MHPRRPKDFFAQTKQKMLFVRNGGDASTMQDINWNVIVTGNPGTVRRLPSISYQDRHMYRVVMSRPLCSCSYQY